MKGRQRGYARHRPFLSDYLIGLFSVFFSFAVHHSAGYAKGGNKQQGDPEDHVAVIIGLRCVNHRAGARVGFFGLLVVFNYCHSVSNIGVGKSSGPLSSITTIIYLSKR